MSDSGRPVVLVTGVSGDAAQGIVKGLRESRLDPWIVGADRAQDCGGYYLCDAHQVLPNVSSPEYMKALKSLIHDHQCVAFFPGIDSEIEKVAGFREELERTGCRVSVSVPEFVNAASDKVFTARYLESLGLPFPKTIAGDHLDADVELPVILKPRRGNGSRGVQKFVDADELRTFLAGEDAETWCVQEYIEGPEYTCSLLFDTAGQLRDFFVSERTLEAGRTVRFKVCNDEAISSLIGDFAAAVEGVFGSINLQLRTRDNIAYVFEINPRFSGSTAMRVAVGYNEPARLFEHIVASDEIPKQVPTKATVYRMWTELVVEESI